MEFPLQNQLSVIYQPVATLVAYTHNARTHSKHQIRQIADSIAAFSFTNPILIDKTNTIVAGHGRLRAAQLLGMEQVPTIRLETLTPDQVRAYILADNKLAENAGWDNSILAIELQHLLTVDLDFDVTCTGFEVPEIDLILQEAAAKPSAEDVFEPTRLGSSISQPGDLWILGKHRIFCGNSLDEASYAKLMNGRKADAIFVDPPFNVPIDGHVSGNGSIQHREFQMASGEMSEEEFIQFLTSSLGLLARHSKAASVHSCANDLLFLMLLNSSNMLMLLFIILIENRLHTYCMKKFGYLIEAHGGTYDKDEPLHSRVGTLPLDICLL